MTQAAWFCSVSSFPQPGSGRPVPRCRSTGPELGTSGQPGAAPARLGPMEMPRYAVCPDGPRACRGARRAVPHCAMLHHAMPCHAVPCHAVPCCATLPRRAVLRRASLPSLSAQLTTGSCTSIFGTFVLAGETPDCGALGEPLPAPARGWAHLVPLPHPCCPGRGSLPRCRKLHGARSPSCSAETRTPARPHSTAMM